MEARITTITRSDRPFSAVDGTVSVFARIQRINEDITAAESKIERIRNRIERDRQALLRLQARLPALKNEEIYWQ